DPVDPVSPVNQVDPVTPAASVSTRHSGDDKREAATSTTTTPVVRTAIRRYEGQDRGTLRHGRDSQEDTDDSAATAPFRRRRSGP
ncbi:hypothetical protein, partial [Frankia sp. CcWB3]